MKMQWSLIAGLIFALLTAIFAVINVDPVQVNLLFAKVSIPLILLIIGCTLIGGSSSALTGYTANIRCRRRSNPWPDSSYIFRRSQDIHLKFRKGRPRPSHRTVNQTAHRKKASSRPKQKTRIELKEFSLCLSSRMKIIF